MYRIAIISKNSAYIDSLKHCLAYSSAEDLHFSFFQGAEVDPAWAAHFLDMDLLLADEALLHQYSGHLPRQRTLALTETESQSQGICIYQSIDHFLSAVRRALHPTKQSAKQAQEPSREEAASKVWLFDPLEGPESKALFASVCLTAFEQGIEALCVDASAYGTHDLMRSFGKQTSLSQLLAGNDSTLTDSGGSFRVIGSVNHPFDLWQMAPEYIEGDLVRLSERHEVMFIHSGTLSESQMRAMVRIADELVLTVPAAEAKAEAQLEALDKIEVWMRQIKPSMRVSRLETKRHPKVRDAALKVVMRNLRSRRGPSETQLRRIRENEVRLD